MRSFNPPSNLNEAMCELGQIVAQIETGELSLDEMLRKHERGSVLIRYCREALDRAEAQMHEIERAPHPGERPFERDVA